MSEAFDVPYVEEETKKAMQAARDVVAYIVDAEQADGVGMEVVLVACERLRISPVLLCDEIHYGFLEWTK